MPSRIPYWLGTAALACVLVSPAAPATGAASPAVALSGILGSKALLVVDGTAPRALAAGERHLGVTVASVGREEAVIERDGARYTVRLGEAPVSVGSRGGASPGASGSHTATLQGLSQNSICNLRDLFERKCTHTETVAFDLDLATVRQAAAAYRPGERTTWPFQITAKSGHERSLSLSSAEFKALVDALDGLAATGRP